MTGVTLVKYAKIGVGLMAIGLAFVIFGIASDRMQNYLNLK